MIAVDENFVDAAAPNSEAIKNGRGLVLKHKFTVLNISPDQSILFGECQGSGKEPYRCSSDFIRPDKPTHRCTCPSRQFPCKHCLGLMYAYVQKKPFQTASVPADVQAKREKLQARAEVKPADPDRPKQVNLDALAKKIKAQLEGIDILERLTGDLCRTGVGNMNAKLAAEIEQRAKALGDTYLPGAQMALQRYTVLFADETGVFADPSIPPLAKGGLRGGALRERIFSEALDQLGRLHALVKQGRAYLTRRLEDPALKPETDTAIAAWLGHAWQLGDLKEAGRVETNAELIQLAFTTYDDPAGKELIDTGVWMTLANGCIRLTQNYRPYRAVKYIKSDDSFFQVAQVAELCVYPGDVNPRVRWEGMTSRPLESRDLETIRRHGQTDFAATIKEVKTHLKGPLSDKLPIYALNFKRLGRVGEMLVAEDAQGNRLTMTDEGIAEEPPSCHLLSVLSPAMFQGNTLIARFRHDLDTRQLQIKPLSIVSTLGIIRLTM